MNYFWHYLQNILPHYNHDIFKEQNILITPGPSNKRRRTRLILKKRLHTKALELCKEPSFADVKLTDRNCYPKNIPIQMQKEQQAFPKIFILCDKEFP